MGKGVLAVGLLAAIGVCVYFAIPSGGSASQNAVLAKTLEAVQTDKKSAIPPAPKPRQIGPLPVASEKGPWPKVVVDSTNFAFGRMQVNSARTHTFEIRNEGDADLELLAGQPTCKCTTFDVREKVVKPGQSTLLDIQWKAGPGPDVAFRHGGPVYTNDPKQPEINFAVEGAIEMPYEIMPAQWSFGSLSADQTKTISGVIMTRLFDKFDITSVESDSGKITVTPSEMTPSQKAADTAIFGYQLTMELDKDLPAGEFVDEVQIHVSTQEEPLIIPVRATKFGLIRMTPMEGLNFDPESLELNLGSFSSARGRPEAKLMLIVDQKDMTEEFAFVEKEVDPPFVKVELKPQGTPSGTVRRYVLSMSVPPGRPHVQRTPTNPGKIRLKTNLPSGEVIAMDLLLHSN